MYGGSNRSGHANKKEWRGRFDVLTQEFLILNDLWYVNQKGSSDSNSANDLRRFFFTPTRSDFEYLLAEPLYDQGQKSTVTQLLLKQKCHHYGADRKMISKGKQHSTGILVY